MSNHKYPDAHDPIDATIRAPSSWGFDDRPRGTPPPIPALRPRGTNYLVAVSPTQRRSLPPPLPPLPPPRRAPTVDELAVPWFENTSYTVPVQPQLAPRRAVIVLALAALTIATFIATFLVLRWIRS